MELNTLAQGLVAGSVYALMALSFNIIFRPTNVLNFAQGEFAVVGAMVGAVVLGNGLPWPVALLAVVAAVGLVSLMTERVAISPILKQSTTSHGWLITTLAVSLILANLLGKIWDQEPRRVAPPSFLSGRRRDMGFDVLLSPYQVAFVVFAVVAIIAAERFYRAPPGRAIRAIAEDRDAALLIGINSQKLITGSVIVGGCLAGIVGLLSAPIYFASLGVAPLLLIKGFQAAAIGGVGDNRGALLGGWLIGIVESFSATLFTPGYQLTATLLVLLLVLMIKPAGIFGQMGARHV